MTETLVLAAICGLSVALTAAIAALALSSRAAVEAWRRQTEINMMFHRAGMAMYEQDTERIRIRAEASKAHPKAEETSIVPAHPRRPAPPRPASAVVDEI